MSNPNIAAEIIPQPHQAQHAAKALQKLGFRVLQIGETVRPPPRSKAILRASARDVQKGASAMGEAAGQGHDGATGAGLVDAYKAYKLARSVTPRNLSALPAPR